MKTKKLLIVAVVTCCALLSFFSCTEDFTEMRGGGGSGTQPIEPRETKNTQPVNTNPIVPLDSIK